MSHDPKVVGPYTAREYRHHLRLLDLEQECRSTARWCLFWQVVAVVALALAYRSDLAAIITR